MAKGVLGLPRPMLNGRCIFRLKAHNVGQKHLDEFKSSADEIGSTYGAKILDSGTQPSIQPGKETIYIDIDTDRIRYDDLSMFAETFAKKAGNPQFENDITVEAIVSSNSLVGRPFVQESEIETSIIIEVDVPNGISRDTKDEIQSEMGMPISVHSMGENRYIIDINSSEASIQSLDSLGMVLVQAGENYHDMVIACSMREIDNSRF